MTTTEKSSSRETDWLLKVSNTNDVSLELVITWRIRTVELLEAYGGFYSILYNSWHEKHGLRDSQISRQAWIIYPISFWGFWTSVFYHHGNKSFETKLSHLEPNTWWLDLNYTRAPPNYLPKWKIQREDSAGTRDLLKGILFFGVSPWTTLHNHSSAVVIAGIHSNST